MTRIGSRILSAALSPLPRLLDAFRADRSANYTMALAVTLVPIMGAVATAVDYSELNRQKQAMLHALDAAGVATARRIVEGATEAQLRSYAQDFFVANLGPVDPQHTVLAVDLPRNETGGGTLRLQATLDYEPYFYPTFRYLLAGAADDNGSVRITADTELRLKNTLEVSLVLDNSGSMDFIGTGSGQKRLALLKEAAKELVETLAQQAVMMKQVDRPVQFSLVPFAGSVNVGPHMAGAGWLDQYGVSPVHHENFDWSSMSSGEKRAEKIGGLWLKKGSGWGEEENEVLSRFQLFRDMKKVDSREWVATGSEYVCTRHRSNGTCREGYWRETGHYEETIGPYASWQGCVEARPHPYNIDNTPPAMPTGAPGIYSGDPATLFVPMFAPDEPGDRWSDAADPSFDSYNATNNWWNDAPVSATGLNRLRGMRKYFEVRPHGATSPQGTGPNYSCTTKPLTPLSDVTTPGGIATIRSAIDAMEANGATNVTEGMAWGWRTVSGSEPFSQGRPDTERGNDKVVIVLTDGANTYYTPSSLGFADPASMRSTYSAYGYAGVTYQGDSRPRLFQGTSGAVGTSNFTNANYTRAMNEHFQSLCGNARGAGVLVMTVALDLNAGIAAERDQIDALKECASGSRYRKDPSDPTKPAKLFWNATSGDLAQKFREIADELSNLRIIG